ncbi:MAG: Na(+)-translocating NADH-quinone reductase subunit A [Candidatus Symbiodolus clandestinus]
MTITLKKGLDLPISGQPQTRLSPAPKVSEVALLGEEYLGLRPLLQVAVGQSVRKGELLFLDKNSPGVRYTSPASGTVSAIHRGARRVPSALVIQVEGQEQLTFAHYRTEQLTSLDQALIRDNLINSGLWTALRTRPFSLVPAVNSQAAAIFVTAIDTQPLAADPAFIIQQQANAFVDGLTILSRLTEGKLYLCQAAGAAIPYPDLPSLVVTEWAGPHPAGLVGTHIHHLFPVSLQRTVWHIGYQEVIAIGQLFTSGELNTTRIVSLTGPQVRQPQLLKTLLGAKISDLVAGQLKSGTNRIISGSVLHGTLANGFHDFLGRYHQQITVLQEGSEPQLFGWIRPSGAKYSITRTTCSHFTTQPTVPMTTAQQGGARAMVPIGTYERVMPLDLLPTLLLRALIVGNQEQAQALGCLELDEEDLALCTFVCPGKYNYGPLLRQLLNQIKKEEWS